MSKKLTTDEFIKKSKEIHGDKYDYSLVKYKNNRTKVKIICLIHGEFEQLPLHHLSGSGCSLCIGNNKRTTDEFIKRSKEIHEDTYDYSLVNYINNRTKVKIICPIHGEFEQLPISHINNKQGCPKCSKTCKLSKEDFIKKSKEIHGDKYDYSLVNYVNMKTKVKIICPIHGEFEQIPDNHIRKKYGCPKCQESQGEIEIEKFLKENKINYVKQKTFKDCRYKQLLRFDFYLPNENIIIEYDGEQHFKRFRFEKDDKKLKIRKFRDRIKTEYCINHKIKLIRIKYDEILIEKLNKCDFLT